MHPIIRTYRDEKESIAGLILNSKRMLNGLHEAKRLRDPDQTNYLFFKEPKLILCDKYSEEITLELRKPLPVNPNLVTCLYKVDDEFGFKRWNCLDDLPDHKRKAYEKKIETDKFMHIKSFYLAKGVTDMTAEALARAGRPEDQEKWWHRERKRPFLEVVDEYKYPLVRIYSFDQITAMRKSIKQD
jgi:hypothetical protein